MRAIDKGVEKFPHSPFFTPYSGDMIRCKISCTVEDILNGVKYSEIQHPVALAARRISPILQLLNDRYRINSPGYATYENFMNVNIKRYIWRFDMGMPVRPQRFYLYFPIAYIDPFLYLNRKNRLHR